MVYRRLHENDRLGLERLCRYGARGAIALSRLEELPDGRVSYHMKRALPDGRTHLVMTGMELLRKLAPLIPPPRFPSHPLSLAWSLLFESRGSSKRPSQMRRRSMRLSDLMVAFMVVSR